MKTPLQLDKVITQEDSVLKSTNNGPKKKFMVSDVISARKDMKLREVEPHVRHIGCIGISAITY